MKAAASLIVLLGVLTPNLSVWATPATCDCACNFIRSPGFWANFDNHMTDDEFLAIIQATSTYSSLTVSQAVAILENTGDQFHRKLLASELNAAWNGDVDNALPATTFGLAYWTGAGDFYGQTINQILTYAAGINAADASQELLDILDYLSGGGEGLEDCGTCTVQCTPAPSPSVSPSATPTAAASVSASPSGSATASTSATPSSSATGTASPTSEASISSSPSATTSASATATATTTASITSSPHPTPGIPCDCACDFIRSPGFWSNYDNHMTDAEFLVIIQATVTYNSLTVVQAVAILEDTTDQYHRHLLAAELNAAWNGDVNQAAVGGAFGTSVWTSAGDYYGKTINEILTIAAATAPGDASEELLAIIDYLGGGGEPSQGAESCTCTVSCIPLPSISPSPSSLPSASATHTSTGSWTPSPAPSGPASPSCSNTGTATITTTTSPSPTGTPTQTQTGTSSPTGTPTSTGTATGTATGTPTPTGTGTPSSLPSPTGTFSAVPSCSETPLPSCSETPLPSCSETPLPSCSETPVLSCSETPLPSCSESATTTPSPLGTPSCTPVPSTEMSPTASYIPYIPPSSESTRQPLPSPSASQACIPFENNGRILWICPSATPAPWNTRYELDMTLQICGPGLTVGNFLENQGVAKDLRAYTAAGLAKAGFGVTIGSEFVTSVEDFDAGAFRSFVQNDPINTATWSIGSRRLSASVRDNGRQLWATEQNCINVTLRTTNAGCKGLVELRRFLLPQVNTAVGGTICMGFAQRHAFPFQFTDSGITLLSVDQVEPVLGLATECQIAEATPSSGASTALVGSLSVVLGVLTAAFTWW